jgi:hypothetical protein
LTVELNGFFVWHVFRSSRRSARRFASTQQHTIIIRNRLLSNATFHRKIVTLHMHKCTKHFCFSTKKKKKKPNLIFRLLARHTVTTTVANSQNIIQHSYNSLNQPKQYISIEQTHSTHTNANQTTTTNKKTKKKKTDRLFFLFCFACQQTRVSSSRRRRRPQHFSTNKSHNNRVTLTKSTDPCFASKIVLLCWIFLFF